MQWKMLQQDEPDDYVIATGRTHSIRDMINLAFSHIDLELTWSGEGVDTIATDQVALFESEPIRNSSVLLRLTF